MKRLEARTRADVSILRKVVSSPGNTPEDVVVLTVPITPGSRRNFRLMEDDSITLSFNLSKAVGLKIGDRIEDELFGTFFLTEEYFPEYSGSNGSFSYNVRFDSDYMSWARTKNMMLTAVNKNDGSLYRKEAVFTLTDQLHVHLEEIIRNLQVLGYSSYTYVIHHNAVPSAGMAKCITYSGMKLLDAMNELAEKYECEWWVSQEIDKSVINFGKCETGTEKLFFETGYNAESISVQRNVDSYANKVYAYGSTINVPETYRKTLSPFKAGAPGVYPVTRRFGRESLVYRSGYISKDGSYVSGSGMSTDYINVSGWEYAYVNTVLDPGMYCNMYDARMSFIGPLFLVTRVEDDKNSYGFYSAAIDPSCVYIRLSCANYYDGFELILEKNTTDKIWFDSERKLLPSMVFGYLLNPFLDSDTATVANRSVNEEYYAYGKQRFNQSKYSFEILGDVLQPPRTDRYDVEYSIVLKMILKGDDVELNEEESGSQVYISLMTGPTVMTFERPVLKSSQDGYENTVLISGTAKNVYVSPGQDIRLYGTSQFNEAKVELSDIWIDSQDITFRLVSSPLCDMKFNGATWRIAFNPHGLSSALDDSYYGFSFVGPDGTLSEAPIGFSEGSEFSLCIHDEDGAQYGLDIISIPAHFFMSEYDDPTSLCKIGENRLMLPVRTGGYVKSSDVDESVVDTVCEQDIIFEWIYPRCLLRAMEVKERSKSESVVYYDGSSKYWPWTEYAIKAERIQKGTSETAPFPFKRSYVQPGVTLRVKFLTPEEEMSYMGEGVHSPCTEQNYRLAGMSFDVNFTAGSYTIIRNEEFGAKLPNDILRPSIYDPFVIEGWNVRAMGSLGLLEAAEEELKSAADEYMSAMEESQFVFTCNMMSDYPFSLNQRPRINNESISPKAGPNMDLYVMPLEGTKVRITHDALSKVVDGVNINWKESRIIGYEFHLDRPYDSPVYEVGETEAYSRLKKIERQISKLG